ncbi:hypothetical protein [Sphingobacterium mizutaii]|uniref:hypothetical protein n=1 Tax=Sphingobacterium mizutaii TaxID=1010 RepID=UPI0016289A5D|nr:hypothetical protein [Sphingobacterium mizutaii]
MKKFSAFLIISLLTSCIIIETPFPNRFYRYSNDTDLDLELIRYDRKYGRDKDNKYIYRYKINKKDSLLVDDSLEKDPIIDSIKIVFEDGKFQMFKRSDRDVYPKRWEKGPLNIARYRQTENIDIRKYTIDNSIYNLSN